MKTLKATVHWYDNSSHEGMAKLADGSLVFITCSVMKYKPTLKDGDTILIKGIDGLYNVVRSKTSIQAEIASDLMAAGVIHTTEDVLKETFVGALAGLCMMMVRKAPVTERKCLERHYNDLINDWRDAPKEVPV